MYSIFLYDKDTNECAELDVENINLETVFSIAEVSDISVRKDLITKTLTLKGTDRNNLAFGNLFHLNRHADISIPNKLFFNYTPIRRVDCLVYEDSMLLINGELIVTGIDIDENGNVFYETVITGKFIGFKAELGDKLLTDLNFIDLKHRYYPPHIVDSWGGYIAPGSDPNSVGLSRTQRYDPDTNTYYYTPFQLGSGYIYPFIDYGEKFVNPDLNQNYERLNMHNYRAAVWVREYFNRIFSDAGYTYELKGNSTFIELFDRLLVPNASESLTTRTKDNRVIYSLSTTQDTNFNKCPISNTLNSHPVKFSNQDNKYLTDWSGTYGASATTANREKNVLVVKRNFKSDARVQASGFYIGNSGTGNSEYFSIQLVKRNFTTSTIINVPETQFNVIAEQKFHVAHGQTINFSADFTVPEQDYKQSEQLQVRLLQTIFPGVGWGSFEIQAASLNMSKDSSTFYTSEISGAAGTIDMIVPEPPSNIKQFDFVKSVINLLNLYCYSTKDRPKHLILEQYDEYYGLASPLLLKASSLDWTSKVNYSGGFRYASNVQLPKKYLFSYKEDSDYVNAYYKGRYNEVYGSKRFEDNLGLQDEKKLELVFSPSPMVNIPGNYMYHASITADGLSLSDKNKTQSNIRILHYNGVHACQYQRWGIDTITGTGEFDFELITAWDLYANATNYVFDPSTDNFHTPRDSSGVPKVPVPLFDLNFSAPKEYYFNVTSAYNDLPTVFDYYKGQIGEITNPNLYTVECEVFLSEVDISLLNLKIPIFINLGKNGYSYFKILNVTYGNNKQASKVLLQKISM